MPYLRRKPKIASTGRVTVRLTPPQRDWLLASGELPRDLGHALHRASVRAGKLMLRVNRTSLDALIGAAARKRVPDRNEERAVLTLLRYLESLEEQFDDTEASDRMDGPLDGDA